MDNDRKQQIQAVAKSLDQASLSDEELEQAITLCEECFVFLQARGPTWGLATNALRRDLENLLSVRHSREQFRSMYLGK